jgi:hypothetical protein
MASILRNQAEAFARSVDDLLTENHEWAMLCGEIEDAIPLGLALFDAIERLDTNWREAVKTATGTNAKKLWSFGEELPGVIDAVRRAHATLAEAIRRVEAEGYVVDGAVEFQRRLPVPFDERPLNIPLTGAAVAAFVGAAAGPKVPDLPDDADDDL